MTSKKLYTNVIIVTASNVYVASAHHIGSLLQQYDVI